MQRATFNDSDAGFDESEQDQHRQGQIRSPHHGAADPSWTE